MTSDLLKRRSKEEDESATNWKLNANTNRSTRSECSFPIFFFTQFEFECFVIHVNFVVLIIDLTVECPELSICTFGTMSYYSQFLWSRHRIMVSVNLIMISKHVYWR